MSEHNERLADIVAQIRAAAYIQNADPPQSVLRLADRIEAAWRQERAEIEANALTVGGVVEAARNKPGGNAAAMREVLEMMSALFDKGVICTSYANTPEEMEQIEELYQKAKAALAAPTRNCDKYATYDAAKCAWYKEPIATLFSRWLFAPANEKGDDDASK